MTDHRWNLLVGARSLVVEGFSDQGVTRVEYVSAFPQDDFAVWLATTTDAQAQALSHVVGLRERVAAILVGVGFREDELSGLMVVTQSQEAVDRDYGGSWFYALR